MSKLLFLAASPAMMANLSQGEELRAIEQKVRKAKHRDSLSIVTRTAARYEDLVEQVAHEGPDILHLSGHSDQDGQVVFMTDDGDPSPVAPAILAAVFSNLGKSIRLLVLNGCHTSALGQRLVEHVDCVIAANGDIDDRAAIAFAAALYGSIAEGTSVQRAHDVARLSVANAHPDQPLELLEREPGLADSIYLAGDPPIATRPPALPRPWSQSPSLCGGWPCRLRSYPDRFSTFSALDSDESHEFAVQPGNQGRRRGGRTG